MLPNHFLKKKEKKLNPFIFLDIFLSIFIYVIAMDIVHFREGYILIFNIFIGIIFPYYPHYLFLCAMDIINFREGYILIYIQ